MAGTPLSGWLEELAETAADGADDASTRSRLAAVVHDLERRAGAGLGDTDRDPVVVLWRRLDRASRLLLAAEDRTAGTYAPAQAPALVR